MPKPRKRTDSGSEGAKEPAKAVKPPAEPVPSAIEPPATITGMLERERIASEAGIRTLDKCIAKVEQMLEGGEYDSKIASHLSYLLVGRSDVFSKIRQFSERVKVQSSMLSPEQERRAIAKVIQQMPEAELAEFRSLLDKRLDDIELVRI